MSRFHADTAFTPGSAPGSFEVDVSDGWWVVGAPNGGYLAGLIARVIEAGGNPGLDDGDSTYKRIRSVTFHFMRAPKPGSARIETAIERTGRSVATVTARLVQDDVVQVFAVATLGTTRPGPEWNDLVALTAPDPDEVPNLVADPEMAELAATMGMTIGLRYSLKPWIGSSRPGLLAPGESGEAVVGGWIRFSDNAPIDRFGLVALADAWAPPIIVKLPGVPPVAPTVELTVQVRNEPLDPSDWVLAKFSSPYAAEGYTVEDAEIWDRHGRLLATARQLAVVT
ncbi:MAG: thioesterase family protein [Actinobacteria bacterium]|nr:thioesterase family protein [Actinomycetota bacterium]